MPYDADRPSRRRFSFTTDLHTATCIIRPLQPSSLLQIIILLFFFPRSTFGRIALSASSSSSLSCTITVYDDVRARRPSVRPSVRLFVMRLAVRQSVPRFHCVHMVYTHMHVISYKICIRRTPL